MGPDTNGPAPPTSDGGQPGARYELIGRLAVGGMAELYLARTTGADGRSAVVVLKRILPHLAEDPDFVRMFKDEAYLAATLKHPNIVRVYDIGRHGEDFFFTMEYVHGENLRAILRAAQQRGEQVPWPHVLTIALGVASALHYAHEQVDHEGRALRVVHRDVSPTNVLVGIDGAVKLVDFGIAKAAAATHVTQAGMLKGKASYMAPEQCRAEAVDRRSDVFAIGILLYEMTTLTRLFRGDNELAILHQVLNAEFNAPSERREGYPPELEKIVLRALARQPDDRYQTALEMQQDLERFSEFHQIRPSKSGLAAYLRDLFGEKPLPWAEAETDEPTDSAAVSDSGWSPLELLDETDLSGSMPATHTPPSRARGVAPQERPAPVARPPKSLPPVPRVGPRGAGRTAGGGVRPASKTSVRAAEGGTGQFRPPTAPVARRSPGSRGVHRPGAPPSASLPVDDKPAPAAEPKFGGVVPRFEPRDDPAHTEIVPPEPRSASDDRESGEPQERPRLTYTPPAPDYELDDSDLLQTQIAPSSGVDRTMYAPAPPFTPFAGARAPVHPSHASENVLPATPRDGLPALEQKFAGIRPRSSEAERGGSTAAADDEDGIGRTVVFTPASEPEIGHTMVVDTQPQPRPPPSRPLPAGPITWATQPSGSGIAPTLADTTEIERLLHRRRARVILFAIWASVAVLGLAIWALWPPQSAPAPAPAPMAPPP